MLPGTWPRWGKRGIRRASWRSLCGTRFSGPRCWGGATAQRCQSPPNGETSAAWLGARTEQVTRPEPDLGGLVVANDDTP